MASKRSVARGAYWPIYISRNNARDPLLPPWHHLAIAVDIPGRPLGALPHRSPCSFQTTCWQIRRLLQSCCRPRPSSGASCWLTPCMARAASTRCVCVSSVRASSVSASSVRASSAHVRCVCVCEPVCAGACATHAGSGRVAGWLGLFWTLHRGLPHLSGVMGLVSTTHTVHWNHAQWLCSS